MPTCLVRKLKLSLHKVQSTPAIPSENICTKIQQLWKNRYAEFNQLQELIFVEGPFVKTVLISQYDAIETLVKDIRGSPPPPPPFNKPVNSAVLSLRLSLTKKATRDIFKPLGLLVMLLIDSEFGLIAEATRVLNSIFDQLTNMPVTPLATFGKQNATSIRLLKLIVRTNDDDDFILGKTIAMGRHGSVHVCESNPDLVVKKIHLGKATTSISRLFNEVLALQRMQETFGGMYATGLHSFGLDADKDVRIVMKKGVCTLTSWRATIEADSSLEKLKKCLNVMLQVVECVYNMFSLGIVHYDIKCDNILRSLEDRVILADFGESVCFSNADMFQYSSRGTECIKSPEMLQVCTPQNALLRENHDRRRSYERTTNSASDIWSIGCLLYELLCQEFLFCDADQNWALFFSRLTSCEAVSLISNEKKSKLVEKLGTELGSLVEHELLYFVLQRDPRHRPTIVQLKHRIQAILENLE